MSNLPSRVPYYFTVQHSCILAEWRKIGLCVLFTVVWFILIRTIVYKEGLPVNGASDFYAADFVSL